MITYTTAQQTAIEAQNQDVVTAVKIETASPLYFCDGLEPVTISSDVYVPHELHVGSIRLGDPSRTTGRLKLQDLDGELAATWISEGFSGADVTLYELILVDNEWTVTRTLPLICTTSQRSPAGFLELTLSGGTGLRARGGLETATRAKWRYAPQHGEAAQVGLVIIKA